MKGVKIKGFQKLTNDEKRSIHGGALFTIGWFVAISYVLNFLANSAVSNYKILTSDNGEISNSELMGGGKSKWETNEDKNVIVDPIIRAF